MRPSATARVGAMLVAVGVLAAACTSDSGSSSDTSSDTSPGTAASETVAATDPPDTSTSTTSSTSTSSTTTSTTIPVPSASASISLLADTSGATYDDDVWDAAAAPQRGAVVVVGTRSARDGTPPAPTVWNFIGDQVTQHELQLGEAVEALPRSIAVDERTAVVVGSALDDGRVAQTAVWTSSDGGGRFGPPDLVDDVFSSVTVAIAGDATLIVGATTADDAEGSTDRQVVALRQVPGEEPQRIDLGTLPGGWVTDAVVSGDLVVATGGFTDGGGTSQATTWVSADRGATFEQLAPEVLAGRDWFGGLSLGGDGVIGVANSASLDAPVLVTSADGRTWRTIPISVTIDEQPRSLSGENALGVASGPAGLVVTIDDVYPRPALLGPDGVGAERQFGDVLDGMPTAAYPFAFFDLTYVTVAYPTVVTTASPDLFGEDPFGQWSHAPASAVEAGDLARPAASGADLLQLGDAVYATSKVWPSFTELDGAVLWGDGSEPLRLDGAEWVAAADEFPDVVTDLAANGDDRLLISHLATDPEDDLLDGPAGGVFGRMLVAGSWGASFPILTGPGGEGYAATVGVGDGFVVVGAAREVTPEGTGLVTPIAARVVDGVVTELPLGIDLGEYATFGRAANAGDLVVATGSVLEGGIFAPLVMTLDGDTWSRVELPTDTSDVDVVDLTTVADAVHLLVREDGQLVVYEIAAAGEAPVRTPIEFDDHSRSRAIGLVEVAGEPVIVGWTVAPATSTLAAWTVTDGEPVAVEIDGLQAELEASYEDAIAVDDDTVLVAGRLHNRNVAWEITLR